MINLEKRREENKKETKEKNEKKRKRKKRKKKKEKRKEKERGKETSILGETREGQTQSIWFGEILLLLSIILHNIVIHSLWKESRRGYEKARNKKKIEKKK